MRRIFDRNIKSSNALLYPGMGKMQICYVQWFSFLESKSILCPPIGNYPMSTVLLDIALSYLPHGHSIVFDARSLFLIDLV